MVESDQKYVKREGLRCQSDRQGLCRRNNMWLTCEGQMTWLTELHGNSTSLQIKSEMFD